MPKTCISDVPKESDVATGLPELITLTVGEDTYIRVNNESEWQSSNECVTVFVTGRGAIKVNGTTDGVAKLTDGKTSITVSVKKPAGTEANFEPESTRYDIDLSQNEYAQIVIKNRKAQDFTYSSQNPSIAQVDTNGKIHGLGKGATNITVTEKSSGRSKNIVVAISGIRQYPLALALGDGMSDILGMDGHVQGVISDPQCNYFYYSFANGIVMQAADGTVAGTIKGFPDGSHVGDLAYNPADGKIYAALCLYNSFDSEEVATAKISYMIMFDPDDVTSLGTDANKVCKTVYVGEPIIALASQKQGDFDLRLGGKHGMRNAIDACTFGPKPGETDGKYYLTLGGSKTTHSITCDGKTVYDREDADYMMLMQFDVSDWDQYAVPLSEIANASGPKEHDGLYYYYCGYRDYGVQNLCYDPYTESYFASTYNHFYASSPDGAHSPASDRKFPNFVFFVIDATKASEQTLVGCGGDKGLVLESKCGITDAKSGTRGYHQGSFNVSGVGCGMMTVGDGYYYLGGTVEGAIGEVRLFEWDERALTDENVSCIKKSERE